MDCLLWNMAVLHISKRTVADVNCYGLVLWNVAVIHISKCTEADIKCDGLAIMKCGVFTH
jgi:hypothetical protein